MSDQGLIWVDISPDFNPIDYAQTFAGDDVVEALSNAESPEAQLLCLYENGYLSKRDGRMKYLLPADLDESRMAKARGRAAAVHKAGKDATEFGRGIVSRSQTAKDYAKGAMGAMSKGEKMGGAAALSVGSALAARALYKKMKARKSAKKESFDDKDIEFLMQEANLLGFEIETFDDLDEAIMFGSEVDAVLLGAEEEGLTENHSDEDILNAYFSNLSEEAEEPELDEASRMDMLKASGGRMKSALGNVGAAAQKGYKRGMAGGAGKRAALQRGASGAAKAFQHGTSRGQKAALGAGAAAGGLAARALYKKMKARKAAKQESFDSFDLQRLITDAQELGFEFNSYDALVETIKLGELVDTGFDYYLGDAELAEGLEDADELDVMEALLYDLNEEDKGRIETVASWLSERDDKEELKRLKGRLKRGAKIGGVLGTAQGALQGAAMHAMLGRSGGRGAGISRMVGGAVGGAAGGAATGAGVGAGVHAYKQRKKRKKSQRESQNESQDTPQGYTGYRSSAGGGVYESVEGPVNFGTGNALYNRIRKDLLN